MLGSQAISTDLNAAAERAPASRRALEATLRISRAFLGIGQPHPASEAEIVPSWGWIPALSLTCALALALIALGLSVGEYPGPPKLVLFVGGILLIFLPLAARLTWPRVSRFEQIGLLLLAGAALYIIKFLTSPFGFTGFDEFLHWVSAEDMLEQQRLFTPNALLPISPLYPGLEIAATAVATLTGLPLFTSALLLLAVSRVIFICALFLFVEAVTASSRIAAIACLIYMGNSSFPIFHISFSYESLAVVFLILALLAAVSVKAAGAAQSRLASVLAVPFLFALAMTHHITALIAVLMLAVLAAVMLLGRGAPRHPVWAVALTATGAFATWGWLHLMGNPLTEYLLPSLQSGLGDLVHMVRTWTPARKLFVSTDGSTSPLWQRLTMLLALALICLGLAMGFFRAIGLAGVRVERRRGLMPVSVTWTNDWLVMLVLLTLAFPITLAFRLTESAWELGNRIGPYLYFGVAPVVALAVAGAWQGRSTSPARATLVGAALASMLTGGVFTAWGGPIELPRRYKVVADALSVEPMGINAAKWTKIWLGPDNRFISDRINRLLLTTHGRQQVVTTLLDRIDTSRLMFSETLGPEALHSLKSGHIDYVLVDMRLTQALPRLGVYFERGEESSPYSAPPEPETLLKFNETARVSRHFDNGTIIIYGLAPFVRYLRDER